MSKAKQSTEAEFTRGQTSILIAVLLGAAVFVGWTSDRMGAKQEYMNKAEAVYIVKYECVVAVMDGRHASKYRCDLPEKRYLSSGDLHRQAVIEAGQRDAAAKQVQ